MSLNYTSDVKFVRKLKEKKKNRMNFSENETRDSSKCTAIDIDTISCIREQMFPDLIISDTVATYLADDVTHKIREILHNARTKIRHSKRRTLMRKDLDSVMELSNIQRIYGSISSDWIYVDGRYTYDDPTINLFDLAFQSRIFVQDGPPHLTFHSISTDLSVEQQYYENICKSVFSPNKKLSIIALNSLKTNKNIGNLVDLFSTFCFFAFIVDKAPKSLVLNMFKNLIYNPNITFIESGNGLKLMSAFLVSELFPSTSNYHSTNKDEYHDQITTIIILLITRWKSLEPVVLLTMEKYINNLLNICCISINIVRILCHAGIEITNLLYWNKFSMFQLESQLDEIFVDKIISKQVLPNTDIDYDLRHCLWIAAAEVFRTLSFSNEWSKEMSILLGDSCVPLYPHFGLNYYDNSTEKYSLPELTKRVTIRKLNKNVSKKKFYHEVVFEDYGGIPITKKCITINYGKCIYAKSINIFYSNSSKHNYNFSNSSFNDKININSNFIIKNTKYLPSLELLENEIKKKPSTCKSHSLLYLI